MFEMNMKVDVICLGLLLSDTKQIGIYSFSVLFVEGFYMLYVTIRKLINPYTSEFNAKEKSEKYIVDLQSKLKNICC